MEGLSGVDQEEVMNTNTDVARMRERLVTMLQGNQMSQPATTDATPQTRTSKRRGRPRKRRDTPEKKTESKPSEEAPDKDDEDDEA